MDSPTLKLFFQKNCLLSKIISKNQVNRRNIFTGKNPLFIKSINNILWKDQWNYQPNCYERTLEEKYEDKKIQHIYSKRSNFFMQYDIIMNCSFGYQNILLLLFYSASEENIYLIQKYFLPDRNCHHHWEI